MCITQVVINISLHVCFVNLCIKIHSTVFIQDFIQNMWKPGKVMEINQILHYGHFCYKYVFFSPLNWVEMVIKIFVSLFSKSRLTRKVMGKTIRNCTNLSTYGRETCLT